MTGAVLCFAAFDTTNFLIGSIHYPDLPLEMFPFLQLPAELRSLVYKRIPIDIRVRTICTTLQSYRPDTLPPDLYLPNGQLTYNLVQKYTNCSILCVNRQIRGEAFASMQEKLEDIKATPLRIIVDIRHAVYMNMAPSPITYLSGKTLRSPGLRRTMDIPAPGREDHLSTACRYRSFEDPSDMRLWSIMRSWLSRTFDDNVFLGTSIPEPPVVEIAIMAPRDMTAFEFMIMVGLTPASRMLHGSAAVYRRYKSRFPVLRNKDDYKARKVIAGRDIEEGEEVEWREGGYAYGNTD